MWGLIRRYGVLRARRDQRGAAAVEFALIAPLLFSVLFGIISYGLWLDDSLNLRQGVREAARQAVVGNYGTDDSCPATYVATTPAISDNMKKLVCQVKADVSANTGETYVKIALPYDWQRGREVVVCSMVKAERLPGLVPLPKDGIMTTQTRMSIENVDVGQVETGGEEVPPAGADWSWCT